ncbi:hypothetical protein PV10_06081 [Exophiala mesophila]|uniref:BD-FAE-like domain-containing protein n=1 Tax=Exophiala mesophila TaxID=212818 RepID=A0A0D1ZXM4_EXOME|nr:uncharacterized protein PV10_06081 [Exophiala mesophila]KIV91553.1 hypothetical protein PV10_06081 [Exophiala mesophila]
MPVFHHVMPLHVGPRGLINSTLRYLLSPPSRRLSSSFISLPNRKHEIIHLPIGLHGELRIDLISPLQPTSIRNLLVHLPSGPSLATGLHNSSDHQLANIQSAISETTTLVSINYRLDTSPPGPDHDSARDHFPTPIHDVTAALDYLTSSTSSFNYDQDTPPKICLVGNHIGGALATTLALTQPNDIHGLAITDPLVDWVVLDEIVEHLRGVEESHEPETHTTGHDSLRKRQRSRYLSRFGGVSEAGLLEASESLIRLRSKLFKTPSAYFDPFASPILFLRAPGRDTPYATTVGDRLLQDMTIDEPDSESDSDSFGPYDDDWDQTSNSSPDNSSQPESILQSDYPLIQPLEGIDSAKTITTRTTSHTPPRRRKVLRRWPSVGRPEEVLLPEVRIFLSPTISPSDPLLQQGMTSLLRAQSIELADLLRRACFYGRESGFAQDRVQVIEANGRVKTTTPAGDKGALESEIHAVDDDVLDDPATGSIRPYGTSQLLNAVAWAEKAFSRES